MKVDDDVLDARRNQLIAENLIQSMVHNYRNIAQDESAVLIGVTSQDMYPRGEDWQFCFGWRTPRSHAAVVSTARMDLHYPGEPGFEATPTKRLRKMVTKDIGILYYGMSTNGDPKSVLYGGILGIQELDQVSEDF
jgi:predicted Zn-dependent protease